MANIASDSTWNIYVTDPRAHCIFKFDSKGGFIKRIGRQGQGPGEFDHPSTIRVTDKYLVVKDWYRFQFLDKEGNYIKSFKNSRSYRDFVINEKDLIFAAPTIFRNESDLIDVLNTEGEILYSFGEIKKFKYDKPELNETKLALSGKGDLFVAFHKFPIVRKYSQKGKLLDEFKIRHKPLLELEKRNLKSINKRTREKRTGYYYIIDAIYPTEDGFSILCIYPRVEILEFNKNGRMENSYWSVLTYNYDAFDFLISGKGLNKKFYVLRFLPSDCADVFSIKEN